MLSCAAKIPAILPHYRASKFDLTVNLRTAYSLALTMPTMLLASANKVIE
jgi:hypothetical protein